MTFTNYPDAMPMDPRNRRLWVINAKDVVDVTDPAAVTAYYNALWDFLLDQNGYALIFRWLIDRDVSTFRPNQPPPQNEAKREMTLAAMTDIGRWLNSECEVGNFRNRGVVTNREIERLAAHAGYGSDKLTPRKIGEGMKSAGWVCLGSHPILGGADMVTQKSMWWVSPVTHGDVSNPVRRTSWASAKNASWFSFNSPTNCRLEIEIPTDRNRASSRGIVD